MSDILETSCGNGVHGDWFPTDSLPLPDEFCWNNCETQLESESSQDDHSSYPVGERLGGTQPCGGCVMIQRKALVSSWCWRFGICRKVQEGSVGCFSRYRHSLGSWFLSRWNWWAPLGGRHLTDMSMRSATKLCSMSQKMAFPTANQLADLPTKGSQNTPSPGKFAFSHS